ncbi:MAG: DUF433 domain-containing protein [Candidatus Methylomirabilis oxygeniifera]|uniref:DUF433 domain-containing protein n=1 Tax=Methylomirabilis oxygeniifera TaxID=671143 RepID=D5MFV9_METO1|nr:MAG: DUF433 domain-containing protein [Candidatus Methylomirabilis oxyfera]CBE68640.1 conserved protein of unknown function [Candidatus Methylomirabilis oxyfera]
MSQRRIVVHSDPEILGGTPVFVGTRVPVKALLDYLEGGHRLDDFLDDFPTVTREQAVAVLEEGIQSLVGSSARAA